MDPREALRFVDVLFLPFYQEVFYPVRASWKGALQKISRQSDVPRRNRDEQRA